MLKIFISYRRDDSAYPVAMLSQMLKSRFGEESVFLDIENIPLGVDFRVYIGNMVGQCNALLAVIGNQWLTIKGKDGVPRLQNPRDPVRIEIEAALERDILVVPVLVDKAEMPSEADLPDSLQRLSSRNGTEVRAGKDMGGQIDRLVNGLANAFEHRFGSRKVKSVTSSELEHLTEEQGKQRLDAVRIAEEQAARKKAEKEQLHEVEVRRMAEESERLDKERKNLEDERNKETERKAKEEQQRQEEQRLAAEKASREAEEELRKREAAARKLAEDRERLELERKALEEERRKEAERKAQKEQQWQEEQRLAAERALLEAADDRRKREAEARKLAEDRERLERERKDLEQERQANVKHEKTLADCTAPGGDMDSLLIKGSCFQMGGSSIDNELLQLQKDQKLLEQGRQSDGERESMLTDFTDQTTGMGFMLVKGGCFQMGDTFGGGDADEKPVHEVCVGNFAIGKHPVTKGQFSKFVKATGFRSEESSFNWENPGFAQDDNHPAVCIAWNDAVAFARWLSVKSGNNYRLPTEAEWEYAARSGGRQEKFSGSDNFNTVAWHSSNSGLTTRPVGQKQANGLGICDMSGNVWEWCNDWYDNYYYQDSPRSNPRGPANGDLRVLRGGYFGGKPGNVRTSKRFKVDPEIRIYEVGFRLVLIS